MRFKAGMAIGFGVGYVLGARAGRERYEQIVEAYNGLRANPGVQRLSEEVGRTVDVGKERVSKAANRKIEQASSGLAEQATKAKEFVTHAGKKGEEEAPTPTATIESSIEGTTTTSAGRAGSRRGGGSE